MLGIPWYVAIFQSFPEALLVLIVGFALFHIKMSWRDAVLIAALSAISTYFLRQAPIVFGVHSIIAIVILVIFGLTPYYWRIST